MVEIDYGQDDRTAILFSSGQLLTIKDGEYYMDGHKVTNEILLYEIEQIMKET